MFVAALEPLPAPGQLHGLSRGIPVLPLRRRAGVLGRLRGTRGSDKRPVGGYFFPVIRIGELVILGARPVAIIVPPAASRPAPRLRPGVLALRRAELRLIAMITMAADRVSASDRPPVFLAAARIAEIAMAMALRPVVVAARSRPALEATGRLLQPGPLPFAARAWDLAAPSPAAVRRRFREVGTFIISHVSQAYRDGDENDDDNDSQSDHERSHRTIQLAMTSRAAQARHARPSTRAFPCSCLRPERNTRLVT